MADVRNGGPLEWRTQIHWNGPEPPAIIYQRKNKQFKPTIRNK